MVGPADQVLNAPRRESPSHRDADVKLQCVSDVYTQRNSLMSAKLGAIMSRVLAGVAGVTTAIRWHSSDGSVRS